MDSKGRTKEKTRYLGPDCKPDRWQKMNHGFTVHEQAGWPCNRYYRTKLQGKPNPGCGVHFWFAADGSVQQTLHPAIHRSHCNEGSYHTTSCEMCTFGVLSSSYVRKNVPKSLIEMGYHVIGPKGDITPFDGCQASNATSSKHIHIPNPPMVEGLWLTIANLAKSHAKLPADAKWRSGGKSGAPDQKFTWPLKFPCVRMSDGRLWLTWWNGSPASQHVSMASNNAWWKKNVGAMPGVNCHGNVVHHPDGFLGLSYVLARALGYSAANAYYYMVGAACSTKRAEVPHENGNTGKAPWCPLPVGSDGKKMISRGKQKYPWSLKAKTYHQWKDGYGAVGTKMKKKATHPSRVWWAEYTKANKVLGDINKPT